MRARIDPLTGIRGFAAGWVVLLHVHLLFALPALPVLDRLIDGGNLGVDLFFMLSGFVISYTYLDRLRAPREPGAVRTYLWLRVARVYPVHLVMLLVVAVLVAAMTAAGSPPTNGRQFSGLSFVMNVLMLQAVPPALAWNDPAWSISTEFAAYLAFPLLVPLLVRLRRRAVLALIGVLLGAGMVALWLILWHGESWAFWSGYALMWTRIVVCFPIGCLLYLLWRDQPAEGRRRLSRVLLPVSLAGVVAACFLAPSAGAVTLPVLAYPFLAALLFALASGDSGPARLLSTRPAIWCGKVSYSVYLVHFPLILVMRTVAERLGLFSSVAGTIAVVAATLAGTVVAGGILYHFVEEPSRRLLRRLAEQRAMRSRGA
ncbi:acyltransferase [uncultured Microbacterium sp.]|uniref:acyltransferase family protein n=1 Tax=uncultured Microbacterium sp. TaxID=191216 RepID=UPI0025DFFD0C|nr:acyltransferase [uncultured Microbacterium sp.]